jgi:hypothetical protein
MCQADDTGADDGNVEAILDAHHAHALCYRPSGTLLTPAPSLLSNPLKVNGFDGCRELDGLPDLFKAVDLDLVLRGAVPRAGARKVGKMARLKK